MKISFGKEETPSLEKVQIQSNSSLSSIFEHGVLIINENNITGQLELSDVTEDKPIINNLNLVREKPHYKYFLKFQIFSFSISKQKKGRISFYQKNNNYIGRYVNSFTTKEFTFEISNEMIKLLISYFIQTTDIILNGDAIDEKRIEELTCLIDCLTEIKNSRLILSTDLNDYDNSEGFYNIDDYFGKYNIKTLIIQTGIGFNNILYDIESFFKNKKCGVVNLHITIENHLDKLIPILQ